MNYKDKKALIYDHGTFVSLAERLAEDFGEVDYFSPYNSSFPSSNSTYIGHGLKGVTRINNFFDAVPKADIIIFPDVGDGDIQEYLIANGKRVMGSRKGEEMELFRDDMKEYMKSIGLEVGDYRVIKGLSALREYLKKNDNKFVKVNIFRGDFETFHAENYSLIEPVLDELEYRLGAKKNVMEFIVEDELKNTVETGMDLYTADGKFPKRCIAGIEVKNASYVAVAKDYDKFPKILTDVNEKLSDAFEKYKYRSFFSTEIRANKHHSFLNDPCCRLGSPPSELYQEMYENISDIIWNMADGIIVDPIIKHKFGVELLIQSVWSDTHWQKIEFPDSIKKYVKLRNYCIIKDECYTIPRRGEIHEIGAVVASADTLEEAIKQVKERASQITAYDIEIKIDSLDEALLEFKKLEEFGIKIL